MLRNLAAALTLTLLSQAALALGLGTLKQSSALNEPFDGRIEILGVTAADADTIVVKLADTEQFKRAGISRDAVLLKLAFKLVDGGASPDYIKITSRDPIREPFLNFLLELSWAKGRVVREYTVLLDPPLYDPMKPRARRATSPPPAAKAPMPAPVAEAPKPAAPAPMPAPQTMERSMPAPAAAPPAGTGLGTVKANDTLWSLATANRPDDSVSVQQMMLALLRSNPEAFGEGNINILKRGAVLHMPDDAELHALSQAEAIAEVQRQHQLWNEYRGAATATVAAAPLGSDMAEETAAAPEEEDLLAEPTTPSSEETAGEGRLELVAPESEGGQAGAGTTAEGGSDETLAREELDARVQENAELKARIDEANEIIDLMRRQVDIKDDELAALQARLAELDIEELGIEAPTGVVSESESADESIAGEAPVDEDHAVMTPSEDVGDVDITIGEPATEAPAAESGAAEQAPAEAVEEEVTVMEPEEETAAGETGAGGSLLGGLIPANIAKMVPGGGATILGVLAIVLLAVVVGLFKLIGGRGEEDAQETAAAITTVADEDKTLTALPEAAPQEEPEFEDEEPATVTRDEPFDKTIEAAAAAAEEETPADLKTIEASAADLLAPAEPEEDPLEEVNVYLAYERFDQAEELVRKVIKEHPDEHKYKLRLLEVFYSSNDKSAYEEAARELHDAVGTADPLWESAVAMWTEMSPERALFEAGGAEDTASKAEDAASAFVDITTDEGGKAEVGTVSPGSDGLLETTQIGLGPSADDEPEEDAGALDFDLSADENDLTGDSIFDLTSAPEAAEDEEAVLDLTGGNEADDVFDITAPEASSSSDDVLDISAESDDLDVGDRDLLDLTAPDRGDELGLLDVTKTGNLGVDHADDLLNVTSPTTVAEDEPGQDDDIVLSGDTSDLDFDISDTVSPAFQSQVEGDVSEEDVFDISAPVESADESLDFDIGGLGDDDVTAEFNPVGDSAETVGGLADADADTTDMMETGIDIEIEETPQDRIDTLEVDASALIDRSKFETDTVPLQPKTAKEEEVAFDLSLQSSELDELSIGGDTIGEPEVSADEEIDTESEIEFDLALQDTTEMEGLVIDDTLELPKSTGPDETLDDLARSMEESMAELDIEDEEIDLGDETGELDLSLADTGNLDLNLDADGADAPSLDFDIEDIDITELGQEDTMALDLGETVDNSADLETMEIPSDDSIEVQSDTDEVDTKLNLAKAYIELGDNDGARSILNEVVRDGTDSQQGEAQRLIEQIS